MWDTILSVKLEGGYLFQLIVHGGRTGRLREQRYSETENLLSRRELIRDILEDTARHWETMWL